MPRPSQKPFDLSSFCTQLQLDLIPFLPDALRAEATEPGYALPDADLPWREWLRLRFPHVCSKPFAARHIRLWNWFDAITPGVKPRPRIEAWPRGGAKSSTAELGVVWAGIKLSRRFVLYVGNKQAEANKHVQTIGTQFQALNVGRAINQYGNSKGWRQDLLRTENGFNVAAFGLDAAGRGVKLDNYRPDLIVFDDFDGRHDTVATVAKKIEIITDTIIPSGSSDCALLFLQNLIIKHGIQSQLVNGTAPFLYDREVPAVDPAVHNLQVDWRQVEEEDGSTRFRYFVTGGTPTWEGQNLAVCEAQINEIGLPAFVREAQHEVDDEQGGLWARDMLEATRVTEHPELLRIGVAVDPNASGGDEAGVIVAGVARVGKTLHGYVLEDATVGGGPKIWAEAAVTAYHKWRANVLIAESNNGGEMVAITISTVPRAPSVELIHASRGKITRAEPIQKLYADGVAHHVGRFPLLETELCTYKPDSGMPSPNRMDALVWVFTKLLLPEQATVPALTPAQLMAGVKRPAWPNRT